VAGCSECDDELSGSCATELVSYMVMGITAFCFCAQENFFLV
jgi:hypothetical protein